MRETITDLNRWISRTTGKPISVSAEVEARWIEHGPDNADAIDNPNYGLTSEREVPDLPKQPKELSITAFNEFGWQQIGQAAFQRAIEAATNFAGSSDLALQVRSVANQYHRSDVFSKDKVAAMGGLLTHPDVGILKPEQLALLMGDNWPTE